MTSLKIGLSGNTGPMASSWPLLGLELRRGQWFLGWLAGWSFMGPHTLSLWPLVLVFIHDHICAIGICKVDKYSSVLTWQHGKPEMTA